jgi:hypothetical protein
MGPATKRVRRSDARPMRQTMAAMPSRQRPIDSVDKRKTQQEHGLMTLRKSLIDMGNATFHR